jgi:hypothetical protein
MEATHSAPVTRPDLSAGMSRANNIDFQFTSQNYLLNRNPEYYVFLYNVSESKFDVSRPPLIKGFVIPGREAGSPAKYKLAARFPQPLLMPKGNVDSNEIDILAQDTRRFVTDIINPDNLGIDQDAVIDPKAVTSQGNNLGAQGLFWSLNGPGASKHGYLEEPTKEEIERAVVRMEKFYRYSLEQADSVAASAPGDLSKFLGPIHHLACDYFGEDRTWHGKKTRTDFCPNCGDRIKAGSGFHRTEDGSLCVIDWNKAIKAGVRTRAQAFEATEDPQFAPKVTPSAPAPATTGSGRSSIPTEQV